MLAPVIPMKRLLIALSALAMLGTVAFAQSLPQSGMIVVTSNGTTVGYGDIENGTMSLELNAGVTGALTINITDPNGTQTVVNASVGASGSITVTAGGQQQDLASYVKSAGLTGLELSTSADMNGTGDTNHASDQGKAEKEANAAAPEQETENSQAGDHSQGNGQVTGSKQPGQNGDNSPDVGANGQANASGNAGDDSVDVGVSLDTNTSQTGDN